MSPKSPKDSDSSPPNADIKDTARLAFEKLLQDAKSIVEINKTGPLTDPEPMVQTLVNLRTAYDQLCAVDPIFSAEENQAESSPFAETQHILIDILQKLAETRPNLYRQKRKQSRYADMYPAMPTSPEDAPMKDTTPEFSWSDFFKEWQPFRRRLAKTPGQASVYATPMEVDHTVLLADGRETSPMDISMWQLTRMSNARLQDTNSQKVVSQSANVLRLSDPKRQITLTRPGRPLTLFQRMVPPPMKRPIKTIRRPLVRFRTARRSEPRLTLTPTVNANVARRSAGRPSFRRRERASGGAPREKGEQPPGSPKSARNNPYEDYYRLSPPINESDESNSDYCDVAESMTAPLNNNTGKASRRCTLATEAQVHANSDALLPATTCCESPLKENLENNSKSEKSKIELEPLLQLHITPREPGKPTTIREALEFTYRRAARTLELGKYVSQFTVCFSAANWESTARLNLLDRFNQAAMDDLQAQLNELQERVQTQETALAEEQRQAARAREQLADRERLISQLRLDAERASAPPPGARPAAEASEPPQPSGAPQSDHSGSGGERNGRPFQSRSGEQPGAAARRLPH